MVPPRPIFDMDHSFVKKNGRNVSMYTFFFIRNRFIRNQGSARQKVKKIQGWSRGDLRNFQIEKIKKWNRDKKKKVNFAVIVYIMYIILL